jgi:FkbM family methyltransferase
MYNKHGWWFPDQDTHFAEMLDKNIAKGAQPVYQEPARRASLELCSRKGLALDIGANVGLWTRDLCRYFSQVVAFEPVEDFRQCLVRNVSADNLQIKPMALGAENTMIDMIITHNNTGHSHVDPASRGVGQIPMQTLDSLNLGTVDYIKIDCEGYEYNILLGARETIIHSRPIIVIEDKKHQDVGHNETEKALPTLLSWGAKILRTKNNDHILGW